MDQSRNCAPVNSATPQIDSARLAMGRREREVMMTIVGPARTIGASPRGCLRSKKNAGHKS
jgi:hypothetical protein